MAVSYRRPFSLASAIAEGVGLSLIYPLLSRVLGGKPLTAVWGPVSSILGPLSTDVFERAERLAVIVFLIKGMLLLASTAVINLLVGLLRQDWSIAVLRATFMAPTEKLSPNAAAASRRKSPARPQTQHEPWNRSSASR